MDMISKLWNWLTYTSSAAATGVGLMTAKQWAVIPAVAIGLLTAWLAHRHRRRMEQLQRQQNEMLAHLLAASGKGEECER